VRPSAPSSSKTPRKWHLRNCFLLASLVTSLYLGYLCLHTFSIVNMELNGVLCSFKETIPSLSKKTYLYCNDQLWIKVLNDWDLMSPGHDNQNSSMRLCMTHSKSLNDNTVTGAKELLFLGNMYFLLGPMN
jgi:hypothetical protein